MKQKSEEQAISKFKSLEKEYINGKSVSFDFSAEVGFLVDRIEDHLRKNSIMCMVIGKNMNSASQENLSDLLREVRIPVVVVP